MDKKLKISLTQEQEAYIDDTNMTYQQLLIASAVEGVAGVYFNIKTLENGWSFTDVDDIYALIKELERMTRVLLDE